MLQTWLALNIDWNIEKDLKGECCNSAYRLPNPPLLFRANITNGFRAKPMFKFNIKTKSNREYETLVFNNGMFNVVVYEKTDTYSPKIIYESNEFKIEDIVKALKEYETKF